VHEALGGSKEILPDEQPTIDFAYASVVTLRDVAAGEAFSPDNVWVKRPGTGEIPASDFERVVTGRARIALPSHHQLRWEDVEH
jgi:N-acetylneuraminate synthase